MSRWDRFEHESRFDHHFEHEMRQGHRFERGDLRYVILDLLQAHPSYGYELIRALEDRFHGFYSPSPGTVYPTLQWLEDLGYVTSAEQDGRKVYTITDAGRGFLDEGGLRMEEIRGRMRRWWGQFEKKEFRDEMDEVMHDLRDMMREIRWEARRANPEKLRRVRDVAVRAGAEIRDILREPVEARPGEAAQASAAGATGTPGPGGGARAVGEESHDPID